ncbi:hypothetical protein B0H14DRAFT_3714182 [Mycena olivaceomarginata]|nr:hypothetical protein B0H14DRAFT_3714182 [Mycena olivaceomarginata]
MKVVIVPALSFVATACKKYRPVAAVLIHVFTAVGFMAAAHPDEIGGSYHHDFCRMFGMIILTNLTLMALTAGRIWWIGRDVVSALEPSIMRVYGTVIAMILESGAIYCMSIVLYLISVLRLNKPDSVPAITVFRAAIPQIMNIAPILILVRVGSGSSVGDETNSYGIRESSCWTQHSLVMHPANVRQPEVALSVVEGLGRQ